MTCGLSVALTEEPPVAEACAGGSAGLRIKDGSCQDPESTCAAISAMLSGLTCTFPEPMVSAASWASVPAEPSEPANVGSGRRHEEPRPNAVAAADRPAVLSRIERPANAVPQP